VFEAKDAQRLAPFEDRRMWRLLLAGYIRMQEETTTCSRSPVP
jgi:hypothetical protein